MTSSSEQPPKSAYGGGALFEQQEIRQGRVPVWTKLCLGVGSLPGQHKDWAFTTLLLFYYAQVLGLPATYTSLALGIALFLDAISDPLVGAISDSIRSPLGRRHGFMLAAILPTSLSIYALFAPPADLSPALLSLWLVLFTALTRIAFTFFDVPCSAIALELSKSYQERTSIMVYRMLVGWLGGVIFIFAMYGLVFSPSGNQADGLMLSTNYRTFAWIIALLVALWMTFCALTTLGQRRFLPQPTQALRPLSLISILSQLWTALGSKNFRLLFLAILISALVSGTGQVFDLYMNLYFWGFQGKEIQWFSLAFVGAAGSFATAGLLQQRMQKQNIMIGCLVMVTLLAMLKVLFRFVGIWPENGDPNLLRMLVLHATVVSYFGSMVLIMFVSMMADLTDEQEYYTGLRQEGVFSAGITFAGKANTGLGLIVGGALLEHIIGFPTQANPGDVANNILTSLAIVDGLVVPALNLIPFLLLTRYTLTRRRLLTLQRTLEERRHHPNPAGASNGGAAEPGR